MVHLSTVSCLTDWGGAQCKTRRMQPKSAKKNREEVATMHDDTKATKNTYQEVQTSALSLNHWRPTWLVRETD